MYYQTVADRFPGLVLLVESCVIFAVAVTAG